jgi:hypothetical protein
MRKDFAKKWTDGGCDTTVLNGRKTERAVIAARLTRPHIMNRNMNRNEAAVCTENLNTGVVVMKSAQDGT